MTEAAQEGERDSKTGRFLAGNSGGPGRKVGSRNLLTTAFLDDLYARWREDGPLALQRMATMDPSGFCRLVGQVLPKQLDASLDVEIGFDPARAALFAHSFRYALQVLSGEEADEPPLIEAEDSTVNSCPDRRHTALCWGSCSGRSASM